MLKLYTTLLFLAIALPLSAQENEIPSAVPERKNEIRLELFRIFEREGINLTYERRISSHSSFGATLNIRTAYKTTLNEYENNQHHFLVFSRVYPFRSVFYLEGFTGMTTSRGKPVERIINEHGYLVFRRVPKTYTDAVLGGAIGVKGTIEDRVTVDFTIGIGKNLFNENARKRIFRGGLSLGYKF